MKTPVEISNIEQGILNKKDEMNAERKYDLEDRLIEFAFNNTNNGELFNTKAGNYIGGQLVRSGTPAYIMGSTKCRIKK